jgi:secretion/DNA translocation related TadE-like protein
MVDRDADGGMATILAAGVIAVLMSLVVLGIHLGAAVLTRHRVSNAADLAALSAAAQLVSEADLACQRAEWVADRLEVRLTACRIQGWEAFVEVAAQPPGWLRVFGTSSAHARAGPAEASAGG